MVVYMLYLVLYVMFIGNKILKTLSKGYILSKFLYFFIFNFGMCRIVVYSIINIWYQFKIYYMDDNYYVFFILELIRRCIIRKSC